MKTWLHLILLSTFLPLFAVGQNCTSQRYKTQVFSNVTVTSGVKFGRATPYGLLASAQDLKMDIYEPTGDTIANRPIVLYQFGGAFLVGWRSQPNIPDYATYLAKCGYVVISIDYRLGFNAVDQNSCEREVYRAMQDNRAALRYMCQRAGQYRIDTNSIFLTGSSAGCITALSSVFMTQAQCPSSYHGTFLEPDDLGDLNHSGNNDYNNRNPHIRGIISHWGAILDTNYITAANAIPVMSMHGTLDPLVPYKEGHPFSYPVFPYVYGSYMIAQRMNHLNKYNVFIPLVNYLHEPELLSPEINDTMDNEGRIFLWSILKPVTSPISGSALACQGARVTYSVTNTPRSRYCWQLQGNGQIVQNNNNSISVIWADTGRVSVTVTELNYMDAQADPVSLQAYVIPHAHAGFTNTINELDVTLSNTSTNSTNYHWDFGDGQTSTAISPSVQYQTDGIYTIQLIASNQSCDDTTQQTVTVHACPRADFGSQANLLNVQFNDASTHATSYFWNFGNGDTSTLQNPFETYAVPGTYIVMFVAINPYCSDTISSSITVHACPFPNYSYTANQLVVSFTDSSQYATNYQWYFGNGDSSTLANPSVTYAADGIYTVTMIVSNPYCTDTFENTVEVHACPVADFSAQDNQLNIAFSDSSIRTTTYAWDFGNGLTSANQNPDLNYVSGGTYTVTLVASNAWCSDTTSQIIVIDSCPIANINYQLSNRDGLFHADSTNTLLYHWEFGDGDSVNVTSPDFTHSYQQNGVYPVLLKVTNALGCTSTDTVTIAVQTTGISNLAASGLSINCDHGNGCHITTPMDHYQMEIYDVVGHSLLKTEIAGTYYLNTSAYLPGIYFVRVSNGENMLVRKFVRE